MPARAVIVTALAEQDIRDIAAYIALDDTSAARQFGDELAAAIQRLQEFPQTGYRLNEFQSPVFAIRVSRRFRRYRICYQLPSEPVVRVVRILHTARDVTALLAGL